MILKKLVLALALSVTALPAWSNSSATAMLNQIREEKGLPDVRYSRKLERAAQRHLNDMVQNNFRAHEGSNGATVGHRLKRAGYRFCYAAENIAWGQDSLEKVMQGWVNSPGHYQNLISAKAREYALVNGGKNIWVMVLASKKC